MSMLAEFTVFRITPRGGIWSIPCPAPAQDAPKWDPSAPPRLPGWVYQLVPKADNPCLGDEKQRASAFYMP